MYQAVIIYAPEQTGVEKLAAEIRAHCGRKKVKVQTRAAREARIPDLAAADLIFIGSDARQGSPVHEDFSELKRSLAGVNLAPRVAGIFAAGDEHSLEALRKMLSDSEVDLSVKFPLSAAADSSALARWLDALLDRLEDKRRGA
jgi:flavodoxin